MTPHELDTLRLVRSRSYERLWRHRPADTPELLSIRGRSAGNLREIRDLVTDIGGDVVTLQRAPNPTAPNGAQQPWELIFTLGPHRNAYLMREIDIREMRRRELA